MQTLSRAFTMTASGTFPQAARTDSNFMREALIGVAFGRILSARQQDRLPNFTFYRDTKPMTTRTFVAATLAAFFFFSTTSALAQTAPLKGTICFAASIREADKSPIACKGLGKFLSVAEIYEHGYRVVSSGVLPETPAGTVFLIIEERK
jgi:hypothetical protein